MGIASKLALAAALLLTLSAPLNAGTVHVGLLKGPDTNKWLCNPSVPQEKPSEEFRCASAKFHECSSCAPIVIANDSDASVTVELEFSGTAFSEEQFGAAVMLAQPIHNECKAPDGGVGRSAALRTPCGGRFRLLGPGQNCADIIEFCPDQSGTSRGQVKVRIEGGTQQTITFSLIGEAIYSPELQAADEARRRHLDELMKIPHVAKVDLDPKNQDIFINVEVEQAPSGQNATQVRIDEVRRAAPPKIEGYDVEVTEFSPVAYAL